MLGRNFSELEVSDTVVIVSWLSWFGFTSGSCAGVCSMHMWCLSLFLPSLSDE